MNPKSVNAHLALANYLMSAGRAADAEASFKQALGLDPGNQLANRGLVAFYIGNGRAVEAEPYLKKLAENDSSPQATYKIALAEYFAGTKRLGDAEKILVPLAASKQAFAASQTRLAAIQYAEKDTTRAHQTIDGVLQREPRNEEALLMKARFFVAERKLEDALKMAQAVVAANPQSAAGQYLLGTIERGRGRPAEAIAAFTEALKLNPRPSSAQVQLSELNLAIGKAETGLQFAEDAAKAAATQSGRSIEPRPEPDSEKRVGSGRPDREAACYAVPECGAGPGHSGDAGAREEGLRTGAPELRQDAFAGSDATSKPWRD